MRPYRALVTLYPRPFREEFGSDLVDLFDELRADRGAARAWWICTLDLLVTLPRMHLERIMQPKRTTTVISWTIGLLAVAGVASYLTDLYPGMPLLLAAVALAIGHRSRLGAAIRVPDTAVRHRRLRTAAILGAVFVACYGVFVATIGDSWTVRETVLALFGSACMIGAAGYLILGLATPRDTTARS